LTKRTLFRPDNRRTSVANEAARLIQEHGLTDFRAAKAKAVERLGLSANNTPLPSNGEIEIALAERIRIFRGSDQQALITELREAALSVMRLLDIYHARLVGPVLSGNATDHSAVDLHLFSDSPETVGLTLDALGFGHKLTQVRHQFRRGEAERFPGYRFRLEEVECAATIFSEMQRRRAPLSPINGKPMRRAGIREVEALII